MASWVTHLMIADGVLKHFPSLDRRGFCVGNIAPDCNVENKDWSAFTPPREVTHWMQAERKSAADCHRFCREYIFAPGAEARSSEEYAFLLGYYAHLITDAAFQSMTRNSRRLQAVWHRIRSDAALCAAGAGMAETWDTVKKLIPKEERMRQIHAIEADYLRGHPDSGYLTEILPLKDFPDYIDYLPPGAIIRKIGIMGILPNPDKLKTPFIAISREEYREFVTDTVKLITDTFVKDRLI